MDTVHKVSVDSIDVTHSQIVSYCKVQITTMILRLRVRRGPLSVFEYATVSTTCLLQCRGQLISGQGVTADPHRGFAFDFQ